MNKAIFLGNITKELEVKETQSGLSYLTFSIAINRGKDKDGQDLGADYISCKAFGKTADNIAKFFGKGRKILVEGHIQTGSYKNKKGDTVYTTDCMVDRFYFCDSAKGRNVSSENNIPEGFEMIDDDEEDLPF